jgi:DNA-binding NtrC family response regulator
VANILVLDEEADTRLLLKRVLELNGHEAQVCRDETGALAYAASTFFDLAILSSPTGRSGTARLVETLKAANKGLKILTILDQGAADYGEGDEDGALLFRPVELDAIESKVRELLLAQD